MPKGPKGEKQPADVIGAAVKVMTIFSRTAVAYGGYAGRALAGRGPHFGGGAWIRSHHSSAWRLFWLCAALVCANTGVVRVACAADRLDFEMTVSSSGMGPRVVADQVVLENGKFTGVFNQAGVRLHLWVRVTGDEVSVSGTIKTGYINTPIGFGVDGRFDHDRFEQTYRTTGGSVDVYRGKFVLLRVPDAELERGSEQLTQ